MGHGIESNDKGVVFGTTWHGLPQYQQLAVRPTVEQVKEALGYGVEKVPVVLADGTIVPGNFALVRTDDKTVINCRCVGSRYQPLQNIELVEFLDCTLVKPNAGLIDYDTAGSFDGGKTAFVSLEVLKTKIKGDSSDTETKIVSANEYGNNCSSIFKALTRIVCKNTFRIGKAEGIANGSFTKFRHHKDIKERMQGQIINLANEISEMELYIAKLNAMADITMSISEAEHFVKSLLPLASDCNEDVADLNKDKVIENRDIILDVFKNGNFDTLSQSTARSRYAMFQATTFFIGHPEYRRKLRKNHNGFKNMWDGMQEGTPQDDMKQKAFDILCPV